MRVPSHEPGPVQSFSLLKISFYLDVLVGVLTLGVRDNQDIHLVLVYLMFLSHNPLWKVAELHWSEPKAGMCVLEHAGLPGVTRPSCFEQPFLWRS